MGVLLKQQAICVKKTLLKICVYTDGESNKNKKEKKKEQKMMQRK